VHPERFDPYSIGKGFALAVPIGLARISLIHSHAMTLGYEFLRVARVHHAPFIQTFHGLPPSGVPGLSAEKQERLFRDVSCFLVNTEFAKAQLTDLGCPADKVAILPQGTDLSEFPFEPRPHPGSEPVRFLTVGRLHEDKGHAYALHALADLANRGMEFRYDIVGYGPEKSSLESLSRRLGIAGRVRFMDEVDDDELRREYREAHIFLFPSLRDLRGKHEETQGVAVQEAQATGCLVVATRTGGIPESVDEAHARLVPDRNPQALASGILDLVRQPERWPEWQTAGRRWVESRYSIDVIGSRLAELYSRVLSTTAASLRT
jgi:colanic acid/amylovoran biosynthesis glycosyltransferase